MTGNRLKLNCGNDKTKTLLGGSRRRVSVSQNNHLRVGSHDSHLQKPCNRLDIKLIGRSRTGQYPLAAYEGRRRRAVGLLSCSAWKLRTYRQKVFSIVC